MTMHSDNILVVFGGKYRIGRHVGYFTSKHYKPEHPGAVYELMGRMWSVDRCVRDYDAGWGEPKWEVEWVPVDKSYTRANFIDEVLASIKKGFMPLYAQEGM
jgi:hypothetical protein